MVCDNRFIIWMFLVYGVNHVYSYLPYKDQAKLLSENGHLYIVSAEGANITLRTRGAGYININEENLLHVTYLARKAASAVEKFETESLVDIQTNINGLTSTVRGPMLRRLERLETFLPNSTSGGYPTMGNVQLLRRRTRILNRRINMLQSQIRVIVRKLNRDDCATNPCKNGGTCIDLYNDFHCLCPQFWEGQTCETDVNECDRFKGTDLGCQNGATCQNTDGGYSCLCPENWFGLHCTRRTYDCTAQDSAEICGHGVCINKGGTGRGFTCICDQGWTTSPGSGTCTVDINECEQKAFPCSHDPPVKCVNIPGSFQCDPCPPGYSGNGYHCADIDECLISNGGCSTQPQVQCINTRGSFSCGPCPPGYSGDGIKCDPVSSLCDVNNGGCNDKATCIHNPNLNYVQCRCPFGWTGSGIGPTGCVQVANISIAAPCLNNPCLNGGTCHAFADGRFICGCLPTYNGPTCNEKVNGCQSNPCKNGGTCRELSNQILCHCNAGYTGLLCENKEMGCVGEFNGLEGTIKWPRENFSISMQTFQYYSCNWGITSSNSSLVIKIEFTHINIPSPKNNHCDFKYLEIFNGRTSSFPSFGRFCGTKSPEPIISTHPSIFIVFQSYYQRTADFSLKWTAVKPECGGKINASVHGLLTSPGSPGPYPRNAECEWQLIALEGKRIQITFFLLDIEFHKNCSYDYLEILDGPTLTSPLLKKFCNTTHPAQITTSSNTATLHFHSDNSGNGKGFQITYTPIEGIPGCGGIHTAPKGRITPPVSLTYQNSYEINLNCKWTIQLPEGERIKLTFVKFHLEDSINCKYDSLAVYDGPSVESDIFGKWCGTNVPVPIVSSTNTLTVIFISDHDDSEGEFLITYDSVCGGHFSESSGIISSPYYPNHYPGSRECTYLIQQPPGKAIVMKFLDVDIEESIDDECVYDYLKIYDGYSDTSPLIGEFCGNGTPGVTVSTHNFLYLVFTTDETSHGRGFYANYSTVDVGCGGILVASTGFISSPKYPDEYPDNKDCHWIIKAKPGYLVQLTWIAFKIEYSPTCVHDWIKIYDNTTTPDEAYQIGESYCGSTLPPVMTSSSNLLMIEFHTDIADAEPGFMATYLTSDSRTACGGNYFANTGIIKSPNYPNDYPDNLNCVWVITVPNGKQIKLNVIEFNTEIFFSHVLRCVDDYLEIRNGGYESSPLINRYCGTNIDTEITSMTNQMYIKFVSDSSFTTKGFLIKWDTSLSGCGGTLFGSSGSIISPNYPLPYGINADCTWRISVAHGSLIKLMILEMDLETEDSCYLDFLEIRDGANKGANLLGKYCKDHMSAIQSSSNHLYLRFHSDMSIQGRGFHLRYITVCNRTITGFRGIIESPNFPNNDYDELNCNWVIEAPKGNSINISFSHLELVYNNIMDDILEISSTSLDIPINTPSKTNESCSQTYLQISEGSGTNLPSIKSATYCGTVIPPLFSSTLDHLYIHYKSATLSQKNIFRFEWIVSGCGGQLKKPSDTLVSPGYPNGYTRAYVCEWYITVDYGKSIEFHITDLQMEPSQNCVYDSLKVYGGIDDKAPLLISQCRKMTEPIIVHTSGNNAFVRFESDTTYHGKGFHAFYRSLDAKCGGRFVSTQGQIHSANYPQNYDIYDDCSFLIQVEPTLRIVLNFTDFDIFSLSDKDCDSSYVAVYDGDSIEAPMLGKFCGNRLPAVIKSSSNQLFVRHKADGENVAKGFIAEYHQDCGASIDTDSSGVISFSESQTVLYNREAHNCSWIVRAKKLDSKITLHFLLMDVGFAANDSLRGVSIYAGEDTTSPRLGTYNGHWSPPPILVPSSAVTIVYNKDSHEYMGRFSVEYSVLDTACGGYFKSESGTIVSPHYPDNYPQNSECVWTLYTSPGNRVVLEIVELNIEVSESCNSDYLEVREKNNAGKLLGVFCGSELPNRLYSNQSMWIKFHSSEGSGGAGFKAHYNLVFGGELFGISGQLASPLYPEHYIKYGKFNWRITVRPSHVITMVFVDLFIEKIDENGGCLDEIMIYDGYDASAPVLKYVCGTQVPEPLTTVSNVVYIEFLTTLHMVGSKFLIDWMQVPKVIGPVNKNQSVSIVEGVLCSTKVELSLDPEKNNSYTFSSPGYPEGYKPNLNCEWIFETEPQNHIDILFSEMDLENSRICLSDYVTLYKASVDNINTWDKIAQLCHENQTLTKYSGNNIVKVVFRSDTFYNKTGFEAIASSVCGGSVNGPNGVIKYPPVYARHTCQWNVTVKPGQTIKVKFNKLKFSKRPEEPSCGTQYILLRDGGTNDSPFLGAGKYCGEVLPDIPNTHSNKLFILFQSGYWMVQDFSEFELEYEACSLNCGRNIILSKSIQSTIIQSPNYPNVPSPHIQCIWTIMAPSGETIHFDILNRFDMTYSATCEKEYLELREGNTELGHLLGRFCNTPPQYIITEGNALYVKYFTDVNEPRDGFKANISLSKCGGNIFNVNQGKILSPGFPESYDGNLTCNWRLTALNGFQVKLRFEKFNLGGTALKHYNDLCDENLEDTLTVTNLYYDDYSLNDSKIFCGQNDSLVWKSDSSIVQITFKSRKPTLSSERMFSIAYSSLLSTGANCREVLSGTEGEIKSPGYPYSRRRVHCVWKITVPEGKRVTFTATDFDLETNVLSNFTRIGSQMVTFYNDERYNTRIGTWHGYKEPGTFIESTSNFMVVTYYLRYGNSHRGFKAKYSSHNPIKCGGELTDKNGTVYLTDIFRTEVSVYCKWEYINKLDIQTTFSIIINANISSVERLDQDCSISKNRITVTDGSGSKRVGEFCTRTESYKPYIISTPYPMAVIYAMKSTLINHNYPDVNESYVDFHFAYKVNQCGGILDSKTEYFVSPQYPQAYASNLDCVWLVTFDEESIIKVTFNSFDLETDCDNDYLAIYNGENARAPLIGKYCGNIPLPDLISNSNNLWFHFHSNDQLQSKGFNISLSPMEAGCGGILHGHGGQIQSLNYPSDYTNNLECDWEIRVDSGFHIGLIFSGRFFIEETVNCTNDYLEVSDYVNNEWKSLGRVCGRGTTKVFNSTTNRMRLLFKTNDKTVGDGFKAIWNVNCGGVIKTDRSGYLYSPGYPQNYKASLDCKYTIDLSTKKVITGQFEFFDLEEASSRGCIYDKVVIYTKNSGKTYNVFGTYCGNSRPPEFYSRGSFMIHFVTDDAIYRKGFVLRYSIPECGGDITEETEIVSPTYRPKGYFSPLDCVWNITAPKDKTIAMRVISRIPSSRKCRYAALKLWDGTEPIRGNNSNLIATLCGEMVIQPAQFRTKGNRAVFEFKSNNFQSSQKFNAIVSFTYGEAAGCGGTIKLSTATYIKSPDKIDNYYLDCHWYIEASESYSVTLTFQHINIENCNSNNISCSCDFIEVYDGPSMNNELIGTFCGNVTPEPISSSRRFISFRFVTDGSGNHSQFTILATPTPSPCGKSVLNVTSIPQELTSPNYPNNYPISIHCKWLLVYPLWATIDIHIVDVDIEPSDDCSKDRLQINEIGQGFSNHFLLWGANQSEKLVIGLESRTNFPPSVYLGSRGSLGKSTFCGHGQTMDYFSSFNRVQISFVSDSQTTAKGFKIRYSIASCSRNYTAPQGRILQSRLARDCTIYIRSTNPNDTISLYFNDMMIYYRQNCTSSLKIYDDKNSTSIPVATICGYKLPNPIFSTGPEVKLMYDSVGPRTASFDIIYTTTDQGRGCGGRFFNYGGVFTSPFYPSNQRKSTSCRWDITVPVGNVVLIQFEEFDLGPASTCATDFITIYDYDIATDTEKFRVRYCGGEKPAKFEGTTNSVYVVYKTSVHNGGTGWVARFASKGPSYGRLMTQELYSQ